MEPIINYKEVGIILKVIYYYLIITSFL